MINIIQHTKLKQRNASAHQLSQLELTLVQLRHVTS